LLSIKTGSELGEAIISTTDLDVLAQETRLSVLRLLVDADEMASQWGVSAGL